MKPSPSPDSPHGLCCVLVATCAENWAHLFQERPRVCVQPSLGPKDSLPVHQALGAAPPSEMELKQLYLGLKFFLASILSMNLSFEVGINN